MAFSGFEMEFVLKHLQTNVAIFDGAQFCINKVFRRVDTFLFDLVTKLLESGVNIGDLHLEYCPGMIECAMTSFHVLFLSRHQVCLDLTQTNNKY